MDDLAATINPITLLAFVVPGFVSLAIYDMLIPSERRTTGKSLLEVVVFGSINTIFLAPISWRLIGSMGTSEFNPANWDPLTWLGIVTVSVIGPGGVGVLAARVRKSPRLRPYILDPTPTAWDFALGNGESYFILFHLRDGRVVGGYYGEGSYASAYPLDAEIYVEELWEVDETRAFVKAVPQTRGGYIRVQDCEIIELFAHSTLADHAPEVAHSRSHIRDLLLRLQHAWTKSSEAAPTSPPSGPRASASPNEPSEVSATGQQGCPPQAEVRRIDDDTSTEGNTGSEDSAAGEQGRSAEAR